MLKPLPQANRVCCSGPEVDTGSSYTSSQGHRALQAAAISEKPGTNWLPLTVRLRNSLYYRLGFGQLSPEMDSQTPKT